MVLASVADCTAMKIEFLWDSVTCQRCSSNDVQTDKMKHNFWQSVPEETRTKVSWIEFLIKVILIETEVEVLGDEDKRSINFWRSRQLTPAFSRMGSMLVEL